MKETNKEYRVHEIHEECGKTLNGTKLYWAKVIKEELRPEETNKEWDEDDILDIDIPDQEELRKEWLEYLEGAESVDNDAIEWLVGEFTRLKIKETVIDLLSQKDTEWKERIRTEIEGLREERPMNDLTDIVTSLTKAKDSGTEEDIRHRDNGFYIKNVIWSTKEDILHQLKQNLGL